MLQLLWLIPALPLAGFLALALIGPRLARIGIAIIGVGSVGLSATVAILVGLSFMGSPPTNFAYTQTLWIWLDVAGFTPQIAFYLDALSLVMILVVTWVGFLIHLYSVEFMMDEEGYSRFFAYMNLFVGSMLTLLLADNLLLLYLGWEGVGLCSYLLIGFWYKDPSNGRAARKAFIVTRVGDTAMAIGLFLLFTHLGTLQIQELMQRASVQWPVGSSLAVAAATLLLGGALGKSAQLPLQTWLPDAMAGPTPVSALIHAATMVTAGVYLIARTHVLFTLAPVVQGVVAIIGVATLLLAGFSALTQSDIKRVLAYSTISQIGYMFLALGVGAWSAAIFHFMTHAFFKALLFLGAGVVILGIHHEHNMFKMGGLRKELPVAFYTFLIGSASLAALPLVTAGFYSKDLILWEAWSSAAGSPWLWTAGLVGALLTSIYTFRMVFLTFFGPAKIQVTHHPGWLIQTPLIILAIFSIVGGFVELPPTLGNLPLFSTLMQTALPAVDIAPPTGRSELLSQGIAGLVALAGIYLAYFLFLRRPEYTERITHSSWGAALHRLWFSGWGFDWLYDTFIVQPFVWLARANKNDFIDLFYQGIAWFNQLIYRLLSRTQTGQVRWYALGFVFGAVAMIAIVVFL
ncbi:MAG: NADH-quinone oxidoreductase subunit L [Anaerolineae bacterium]|nr:NADH-quinone oxidoreductase subunit L [Anaerolineae bacterium]